MKIIPVLVGVGLAVCSRDLQAREKWKECPKGFRHESEMFSCSVRPDGTVRDIRVPEAVIVEQLFIHGTYKPLILGSRAPTARSSSTSAQPTRQAGPLEDGLVTRRHDSRFFQSNSKEGTALKMLKTGEGSCVLKKDGILRNAKYDRGARYAERVTLSPDSIEFEYEVELLVRLASASMMFFVIETIPSGTLANRGFRQVTPGGSKKLRLFPEKYEEGIAVRAHGLKELSVVLDRRYFSFLAGDGTAMNLQDTRAWGGKGYRLDVGPATPWRREPVTYAVGTVFKWSFKLKLFRRDQDYTAEHAEDDRRHVEANGSHRDHR